MEVSCHLSALLGHIENEREILQLRLTRVVGNFPLLHNATLKRTPAISGGSILVLFIIEPHLFAKVSQAFIILRLTYCLSF